MNYMSLMLIVILFGLFTLNVVQANKKCYSCNWNRGLNTEICIKDLDRTEGAIRVDQVACPEGSYCTVIENYYKGIKQTQDMARGCLPASHSVKVGCTDSAEILTCKQVCNSELCNTGDGGRSDYENRNNGNNGNTDNGANTMYFSSYLALSIIVTYVVSLINVLQ